MQELDALAADVLARRQPAAVSIANSMREAILGGVLGGGMPLRQDAIAKRFQVSQVTARGTPSSAQA
jgi:DNA-binding GntR family transcriptional regulator